MRGGDRFVEAATGLRWIVEHAGRSHVALRCEDRAGLHWVGTPATWARLSAGPAAASTAAAHARPMP